MKHLSALEVQYMAAELQQLVKAKLQQMYQPAKNKLILQFHVRNKGRAILKVSVPTAVYIASEKESNAKVSGFCSLLRKKLNNSILTAISQPGFERIIILEFSSKNSPFSLIFELFSKGNIILTNDSKIIAIQEKQHWSSRELKLGTEYKLPPTVNDPHSLDDKQLIKLLKNTNKTDIVRFLAIELSLGGVYAEELCIISNIDKKTKPATVTSTAAKKLFQSLKKLLNSEPFPSVIYENSKPITAVPIALNHYKNNEKKQFKTFSEALEEISTATAEKPSRYDSEISRLKAIIAQQQETILTGMNSAEKNKRAGELIYEHYQEVKELLEAVNTARKQGGWQAVKQLQKTNKKLKSIDEKSGKIVVDV
ncbi:hypothetical protein CMO88_00720 [Candidatus Woesearchaeota archaeon]|nr:hypothetical protein [Candidatus Woesearchaeota archaeon]|tara:strand:+ start:2455 stop:3555 length:1101 start_codon:yes stop_codon:yes gene_type:complete